MLKKKKAAVVAQIVWAGNTVGGEVGRERGCLLPKPRRGWLSQTWRPAALRMVEERCSRIFFRMCFPSPGLCVVYTRASDSAEVGL